MFGDPWNHFIYWRGILNFPETSFFSLMAMFHKRMWSWAWSERTWSIQESSPLRWDLLQILTFCKSFQRLVVDTMKCLIEQGNPNGRLEIWLFIFLFHFFPFFCTFSDQDWHFPDFFFSSGKSEEANFKGTATSFNWNLCELGSIRRRFVFLFQQIWKKKTDFKLD